VVPRNAASSKPASDKISRKHPGETVPATQLAHEVPEFSVPKLQTRVVAHHISAGRNRRRSSSICFAGNPSPAAISSICRHRQHELPWHPAHLHVQYRRLRCFPRSRSLNPLGLCAAPIRSSQGKLVPNFASPRSAKMNHPHLCLGEISLL
jgi:hypothetical protein